MGWKVIVHVRAMSVLRKDTKRFLNYNRVKVFGDIST